MVCNLAKNEHKKPFTPTKLNRLTKKIHKGSYTLCLRLAEWLPLGSSWKQRDYKEGLMTWSSMREEKTFRKITNWPGICGLTVVVNNKLINSMPFKMGFRFPSQFLWFRTII